MAKQKILSISIPAEDEWMIESIKAMAVLKNQSISKIVRDILSGHIGPQILEPYHSQLGS